ncbi:MAG: hypothetical protein LBU15_02275 [Rickettsiales bacterium]|nr:hypothetical protein [Rickettsiales bacterium]
MTGRKFYERLVRLLCLFIPVGTARRRLRRQLMGGIWWLQSRSGLKRFAAAAVAEKSVLLVEPNSFHGEVVPGVVRYWQDLGYRVDLLLQPSMREDGVFSHYFDPPRVFYMTRRFQRKALALARIGEYDFLFLTTSSYPGGKKLAMASGYELSAASYLEFLGFTPRTKYGLMMIEHGAFYIDPLGHRKYADQGRLFMLNQLNGVPMVNPHYFGSVKITGKNRMPIFSVALRSRGTGELLCRAVRRLRGRGITNFRVLVAGRGSSWRVPRDLVDSIWPIEGWLRFPDLWEIYESSDFLMFMLSPDPRSRKKSIFAIPGGECVAGAWQTMMGFQKPALIHSEFAASYQLDESNAILYEDDEKLDEAMERAIRMSSEEYGALQTEIKKLASQSYAESLENLKYAIGRAEAGA